MFGLIVQIEEKFEYFETIEDVFNPHDNLGLACMVVKFSPPWIWPVQESHSGKGAAKGDLSKKALWNSGNGD